VANGNKDRVAERHELTEGIDGPTLAPFLQEEKSSGQLSSRIMNLRRYLATLSKGRLILWCYFVWYVVVLVRYFDSSARLWLTSLGLSAIVGFALYLSTAGSGTTKVRLDRWQVFRLFLMPFCVSSFSALVKGKGFVLIFSPHVEEIMLAVALCAFLCLAVFIMKRFERR
jgi:hypothetical protein